MKIMFIEKTIEITQRYAKRASIFGTEEYYALRSAMNDLPDFQVKIKTHPISCRTYQSGLTYEFMMQYIGGHDEDGSIMQEFNHLRMHFTYAEVKKWFFGLYPELICDAA